LRLKGHEFLQHKLRSINLEGKVLNYESTESETEARNQNRSEYSE